MKVFLSQDDDGHWYIVEAAKRRQWEEFLNIPSSDERSWGVPAFAEPIDGPNDVEFEKPKSRL
jgi:hypothetical protein